MYVFIKFFYNLKHILEIFTLILELYFISDCFVHINYHAIFLFFLLLSLERFFFFFFFLLFMIKRVKRTYIVTMILFFSSYFILYVFVQIFYVFWYNMDDLFFLRKYKSSLLLSEYCIFWHHLNNLRIWRRKMCEKSGIRHLATSLPCEVSQKSIPAFVINHCGRMNSDYPVLRLQSIFHGSDSALPSHHRISIFEVSPT